jgi:hypothetical protein
MGRFAVCALALGLLAQPALAQKAGVFAIEGRNPDGSTYPGTLELAPQRDGVWLLTWRVGGDVVRGLGLVQGDILAAAYAVNGEPGVAAFRILPDGRLDGPWTMGQGVGREVLVPR